MRRTVYGVLVAGAAIGLAAAAVPAVKAQPGGVVVKDNLRVPENYRMAYQFRRRQH